MNESNQKSKTQVVRLINDMKMSDVKLSGTDYYVYLSMKRYMNFDTKETYVSIDKISRETKLTKVTVNSSIKKLLQTGDLIRTNKRSGRAVVYKFNDDSENFEMIPHEFLDMDSLTPSEKGSLAVLFKYFFKENGKMNTTYSDRELAEKTGFSKDKIGRLFRRLRQLNAFEESMAIHNGKDGVQKRSRSIDAAYFGETMYILCNKLGEHEEVLDQHTKDIESIKSELEELRKFKEGILKTIAGI